MTPFRPSLTLLALAGTLLGADARAETVQLTVRVDNLAPAGSVSFAPLHVGFHGGRFDAFDLGQAAGAAIVSVAEGGSGSAWFPAFAAADPGATLGTVLPVPAGPLLPGASGMATFTVDTAANPYFSFAAMVVPSNDLFIGNDSPTAWRLFDAAGRLQVGQIVQRASDVWGAGSEVFDPAAAAFVGNNDLRAPQHSVVAFNFAELAAFDGLTTAPGYVFKSGLAAGSEIYRISFAVAAVPEPETYAMMLAGLAMLGWARRRAARDAR